MQDRDDLSTPVLEASIPSELRDRPQWVAWERVEREGKPTKRPVNPHTGGGASSTDPRTWGTFAEAVASREARGLSGVGFVFAEGGGLVGVDLDHCVRDDGSLEPWAEEWVDALESYTEISPSGTGVHVFVRGEWAEERRNRQGGIEVYARGRFFTVTGDRWPGTPETVEERQEALDRLAARLGARQPLAVVKTGDLVLDPGAAVDRDRLAELLSGEGGPQARRVWSLSGDMDLVSSDPSRRDLWLANRAVALGWSDQETANLLIEYRRRHAQQPEKALRQDYIARTLTKAREGEEEDALAALALLPFKPVKLVQLGRSGESYLLVLDDGTEIDLDAQSLVSPTAFKRAIVSGGFTLTRQATKRWEAVLKALLTLREVEETTDMGDVVRDAIDELLARGMVVVFGEGLGLETLNDALGDLGLFWTPRAWAAVDADEGSVCVISSRLLDQLNQSLRGELTPKLLAKHLRGRKVGLRCLGKQSVWVAASQRDRFDEDGDRRRWQPSVWKSRPGWIDPETLRSLVTRARDLEERDVVGGARLVTEGAAKALQTGGQGDRDTPQEQEARKQGLAAARALGEIRDARRRAGESL